MQARVTTSVIQPGKTDEAIRILRDSIVPAAKQQKGFKGYLGLTDSNMDKSISITVWETEADMKAVEANGYYQEQMAKVAQLLAGPPTMEHYEVIVREMVRE